MIVQQMSPSPSEEAASPSQPLNQQQQQQKQQQQQHLLLLLLLETGEGGRQLGFVLLRGVCCCLVSVSLSLLLASEAAGLGPSP